MADLPSLLPRNSTAFERAIEQAMARGQDLDAELVSAVLDPARCPESLLAFLAWDLGLSIWDDSWPVEKKRHVLSRAWQLASIKTTAAGIREHVALTGATVKTITRPPARGFLRGAMTEAQRIIWLESLPQVRIYPFFKRDTARPGATFLSGATGHRFWPGFLRASRGNALLGRTATWYDPQDEATGEVPVTLADPLGGSVERVNIARSGTKRAFWNHCWHGRHTLTESTAEARVLTVQPMAEGSGAIFAVPSGSQTTDVRPRRVNQRRIAPAARAFWKRKKRFHGHRFLRESFGPRLVFDAYYLIDPERVGPRQKVLTWHGHGQWGIDPFTAKLQISVPMKRHRPRAHRWHGNGYLRAASLQKLARAIEAVSVSKALRDTILIDTTTHRRARFDSGLRFGDFSFGEIRKAS